MLFNTTKRDAEEARDKADDTYNEALSIYTEAESIQVTEVNVDILNSDANQIKSEVLSNFIIIIIYFISISKTNDNNKAPEQPIDMRMIKDNKAKV